MACGPHPCSPPLQIINAAKFLDNGGCGYVLKPPYLRRGSGEAPPAESGGNLGNLGNLGLEIGESLHVLRLQPLGATHVPTPGESRGNVDGCHLSHFAWWKQEKMLPVSGIGAPARTLPRRPSPCSDPHPHRHSAPPHPTPPRPTPPHPTPPFPLAFTTSALVTRGAPRSTAPHSGPLRQH